MLDKDEQKHVREMIQESIGIEGLKTGDLVSRVRKMIDMHLTQEYGISKPTPMTVGPLPKSTVHGPEGVRGLGCPDCGAPLRPREKPGAYVTGAECSKCGRQVGLRTKAWPDEIQLPEDFKAQCAELAELARSMTKKGIKIDTSKLAEYRRYLEAELAKMEAPSPPPEKPLHVRVAEAIGWREVENSLPKGGILLPVPPEEQWSGKAPDCQLVGEAGRVQIPRFDKDWSTTGPLVKKYGLTLQQEDGSCRCYRGGPYSDRCCSGWWDEPLDAVCYWIIEAGKRGVL